VARFAVVERTSLSVHQVHSNREQVRRIAYQRLLVTSLQTPER